MPTLLKFTSNFKLSQKALIRKLEITSDVHFFKIRNLFISNLFYLTELGWQLALTIFADRQVTFKFMKGIEIFATDEIGIQSILIIWTGHGVVTQRE